MNIEEIRSIVKEIESGSLSWDQRTWGSGEHPAEVSYFFSGKRELPVAIEGDCKTRACIAGWTVLRAGYRVYADGVFDCEGNDVGSVAEMAQQILDLDEKTANALFSTETGSVETDDDWYYTVDQLKKDITRITGITFEE